MTTRLKAEGGPVNRESQRQFDCRGDEEGRPLPMSPNASLDSSMNPSAFEDVIGGAAKPVFNRVTARDAGLGTAGGRPASINSIWRGRTAPRLRCVHGRCRREPKHHGHDLQWTFHLPAAAELLAMHYVGQPVASMGRQTTTIVSVDALRDFICPGSWAAMARSGRSRGRKVLCSTRARHFSTELTTSPMEHSDGHDCLPSRADLRPLRSS